MIELHPNLQNIYSCPVCKGSVELKEFIISSMQNLVDITCHTCKRNFYADIPAGHGLFYPVTIDQETREVFQPLNPFGHLLKENCPKKRWEEVELKVFPCVEQVEIVLLNCLDWIYGHSLLKLFNAQYHLDHQPELGLCVLVPRQLTHLVPEGVAEIWEVSIPVREYRCWWVSLEKKIKAEILKKKKVYLSPAYPHPHYSTYSLSRFVKVNSHNVPNLNLGKPVVVFSYRTDPPLGSYFEAAEKKYHQIASASAESLS